MSILEKTRNWYVQFERPISSISLVVGFIFDALTLKRVDTLWENLWILAHLIAMGVFIILIHKKEKKEGEDHYKSHFWFVNILQFVTGGVLSTFLVFYFRSTDILSTWPFILILALAFIANESFKKHYIRLSFQITLFFISVYSFSIFLIPVILHQIGIRIFIISGIVSLIITWMFIKILFYFTKEKLKRSKNLITVLIIGIFVLVNLLYFTNLIPPIPLSLKDGGLYHSISKNTDGNYDVTYESHGWVDYFRLYSDFHKVSGSPVYAYSAIFSPKKLNLTIFHEWQHYNELSKEWATESIVKLYVIGGRDSGFRTYSLKSKLDQGKWRVKIKTEGGQTIGQLRFNLINADKTPTLKTDVKE